MRAIILLCFALLFVDASAQQMMFGDTTRLGVPYAKDPKVIRFKNSYWMYYSIPPDKSKRSGMEGWGIGIAESRDLVHWNKRGEILPAFSYEAKGLCAPGALLRNDTIHLFYQTYGNWKKDAICHAWSVDGIHFKKNSSNPVFSPTGTWTSGRAIDAEVFEFRNRFYLLFATRDTAMQIQMQGVAIAKGKSFDKGSWEQQGDGPVMIPEYAWEQKCVEGASVIQVKDVLYMFYAGAYNNMPQQIGVAKSIDGIHWTKLGKEPFLASGKAGAWNESESGHPDIFRDHDGKTYLFFQGNNDKGKTWLISKVEIGWRKDGPFIKENGK